MKLTRESMLANHAKDTPVSVDGYPTVYLKCLTKAEINAYLKLGEARDKETDTEDNGGKFLLAAALVDEAGERVFTEGHETEVAAIDYPWFRTINKKFNEIHYPDPPLSQIATDAKNSAAMTGNSSVIASARTSSTAP